MQTYPYNWEKILQEYMSSTRPGALVVIGEWGSGKTYIYHNEIVPILDSLKFKKIYVSLYSYGVAQKSLDDFVIEEMVGIRDIDDSGKDSAKNILTSLFSEITSDSGKSGVISAAVIALGGAVKKRVVQGLQDHIFCFDDIDRVPEEYKYKLWSEVNYFVELNNRKAIILIDEKQLPSKTVFDRNYEKNVWKAIRLAVPPEKALEYSFSLLDRDFAEELRIDENLFQEVTRALDVNNIRAIHIALDSIRSMHEEIQELGGNINQEAKSAVYQFLFLARLIVYLNGRSDTLIRKMAAGISRIRLNIYTAKSYGGKTEENLSDEEKFIDALPEFLCDRYSFEFAYNYIDSGHIEIESLKKSLLNRSDNIDVLPPEDITSFLGDRRNISESEYIMRYQNTLEFISNPKPGLYNYSQFISAIGILFFDCSHGGVPFDSGHVETEIISGLNIFIKGVKSQTHTLIPEDIYTYRIDECTDKIKSLVGEIISLNDYLSKIDRVKSELEGWETKPHILMGSSSEFNAPVLEIIGRENIMDFLVSSNGGDLMNLHRFIGKRFTMRVICKIYKRRNIYY